VRPEPARNLEVRSVGVDLVSILALMDGVPANDWMSTEEYSRVVGFPAGRVGDALRGVRARRPVRLFPDDAREMSTAWIHGREADEVLWAVKRIEAAKAKKARAAERARRARASHALAEVRADRLRTDALHQERYRERYEARRSLPRQNYEDDC
jgi:hypothetical protein